MLFIINFIITILKKIILQNLKEIVSPQEVSRVDQTPGRRTLSDAAWPVTCAGSQHTYLQVPPLAGSLVSLFLLMMQNYQGQHRLIRDVSESSKQHSPEFRRESLNSLNALAWYVWCSLRHRISQR